MATIRVNVGTDTERNKKVKADFNYMILGDNGQPNKIGYFLRYYELDNNTLSTSSGNNVLQRKLYDIVEDSFSFDGVIDSGSKVYTSLTDETGSIIPGAIDVKTYFENFAINELPGVGNSDPYWKTAQGILKEVISIRQANGELPS